MSLVPVKLRRKALGVAIGTTLLANALCVLLVNWQKNASSRDLPELIELVSVSNLPLSLCLLAWVVVIAAVEEICSPAKIQIATILLFFGTVFPLLTTIMSFPLAMTVIRRVLGLF